ncbi:MAG: hypothetical protein ACOCRK_00765 [bacterium]
MNDQQWLWYYFNLVEDEREDEKRWKSRLDYLGWYSNPKLAKSVMEQEKIKNGEMDEKESSNVNDDNTIEVQGDTAINTGFEEELKNALKDAGISEDEFVELPDSKNAGNPNESKDDFLQRVMNMQDQLVNQNNNLENQSINDSKLNEKKSIEEIAKEAGLDPDDIDFFEYPEGE